MFKILVRCDHKELNHDKSVPRVYTYAEVCSVDSRNNMLPLRIKKQIFYTKNYNEEEHVSLS